MNGLLFLILRTVCGTSVNFVSTWQTSFADQAIFLPLGEPHTIDVEWGDGSWTNVTNYTGVSHVYGDVGSHLIVIYGPITLWQFSQYPLSATNLIGILSWGGFTLGPRGSDFQGCSNLQLSSLGQPSIPINSSMSGMFSGCTSLDAGMLWNTQNVTNMSYLFAGATSFNSPFSFDTTSVTDMSYMFSGASKFNQLVDLDTFKVTNMQGMFSSALEFNQPIPYDTSAVTSMSGMFSNAVAFNQSLDFNTSRVTKMDSMFENATSFNSVLLFDTSAVTTMSKMFSGASNFNQRLNFTTTSVTDMSAMFAMTDRFDQPLTSFKTHAVVDMSEMFRGAKVFNQDVGFETRNVTNMKGMFWDTGLFDKPLFFDTINVNNMKSMFRGAKAFHQPLSFDTRNVQLMSFMFQDAVSFNSPLHFDTSNVATMQAMFQGATAFNSVVEFNITGVLTVQDMFSRVNLTNCYPYDLSSWISLAENCSGFCECCGLPSFQTCGNPCPGGKVLARSSAQVCNCQPEETLTAADTCINGNPCFFPFVGPPGQCTCAAGYKTVITGDPPNTMTTECVAIPCVGPNYSGIPADCTCGPGYFGNVTYQNGSAVGCEPIPCPSPAYTGDPGNCTCGSSYGGTVAYFGNAPVGCIKIVCLPPAYSGSPPNCVCGSGFVGQVAYIEAVPIGCEVNCTPPAYTGTPGNCTCGSGYSGQAVFNGTDLSGCDPISCRAPAYTGSPANCTCGSGFVGQVSYQGNSSIGCNPVSNSTIRFAYDNTTTTTIVSGVQVTITADDAYGKNGTVEVTVKPASGSTVVSKIVTINFFGPSDTEKNISQLDNPVRFTIPLEPGTADPLAMCFGQSPVVVVPRCTWYNLVTREWSTLGCSTNLSTTEVTCTCNHLTDFALTIPEANQVPLRQFLDLTPENIARSPDGLITIMVILVLFGALCLFSIHRDRKERKYEDETLAKKFEAAHNREVEFKTRWWKRFKAGLQMRHTWGAVIFRKTGTSFRSVDRTFVTLFLVFVLLSMSARFHDRDTDLFLRSEVILFTVLVALLPIQLLLHLFTHTGEVGALEKWQLENKLISVSRFRCLRYRFPEWCRGLWYALVLGSVLGMAVYILGISLMFDQNPGYYCLGTTTGSWLIDFIWPYAINVCLIEPLKIMMLVVVKDMVQRITPSLQRMEAEGAGDSRTGDLELPETK